VDAIGSLQWMFCCVAEWSTLATKVIMKDRSFSKSLDPCTKVLSQQNARLTSNII